MNGIILKIYRSSIDKQQGGGEMVSVFPPFLLTYNLE